MDESNFERSLVSELLIERKRDRLWRNIRFFIWIAIILILILLYSSLMYSFKKPFDANGQPNTDQSYVALVRLDGEILSDKDLSAEKVIPELNRAFCDKKAKGVILLINSPGGSAVQSSIIHDKILELKNKYHKKVIVVGEDLLASGAYLIATAADEIYVNRDTITGSIGVVMSGFGFVGSLEKLGVQRRLFTAGANKARLDPFEPLNPSDVQKIKSVLTQAHANFIHDVEMGRKGKLNGSAKELFSGDFWTGEKAVQLGLADGTGNLWDVMQKQFDVHYYVDYTTRPSFFQSLLSGVETSISKNLVPHADLQARMGV